MENEIFELHSIGVNDYEIEYLISLRSESDF